MKDNLIYFSDRFRNKKIKWTRVSAPISNDVFTKSMKHYNFNKQIFSVLRFVKHGLFTDSKTANLSAKNEVKSLGNNFINNWPVRGLQDVLREYLRVWNKLSRKQAGCQYSHRAKLIVAQLCISVGLWNSSQNKTLRDRNFSPLHRQLIWNLCRRYKSCAVHNWPRSTENKNQ